MSIAKHDITKVIIWSWLLASVALWFVVPSIVFAQQPAAGQLAGDQVTAQDLGLYYGEATGLGTTDIRITIARVIKVALSVLGIIAIVMVIAGGVVWMTAGGDDKKVALAKKILLNGVIGLAIILSAYAITSFVMKSLTEATTGVGEGEGGGEGGLGGFGGRGCANPPCAGNNFVAKISPKGQQRIQNVLVKITFSERGRAVAYDPASLQLGTNIKVYKTDDRAKAQVAAELVQANALELHLRPTGPCPAPNEATLECFEGNVSYTVELTTSIKSAGGRSLYCPLAGDAFNCKRVFITGDQFDNDAPTVAIVNYQSGESVPLGGTAEIRARARDGFGVDTLQYSLNDQMVYASDAGGGTDVTDTFVWDIDENVYKAREAVQVSVQARDVDGHVTVSEPVRLIPRPAHCFNRKQDADEVGPDCGGQFCGACAGAACRGNADCAAGVCRVPAGAEVGVCVELPLITDVNPPDGAAGTVVTIEGRYFGAQAGQVVFYKSPNEPIAAGNLCGAQWSPESITVSVPAGLEANKVAVIGVRTTDGDEDRTNDDRGAKFENVFTVNDVVRPGLCSIDPKSGLMNDRVTARGVNIGNGGASAMLFDDQPARVDRWDQDRDGQLGEIVGFVPNIGTGAVRVVAQVGDKKSNALLFEIRAFREQDRPNIGSVSPDRGPVGTYVSIAGTGFGAVGQGSVVVFEHRASGVTFFADTDFPSECGAGTWNDRLIVVKVPRGVDLGAAAGGIAAYKIYVKRGAAQVQSNAVDFGIAVAGQPAPGICKIDPNMRPTGGMIDIYGENFGNAPGNVIFWDANATPDVATWTSADVRAVGAVWEDTGRHVSIAVPEGAVSGPVKVVRQENQAQSNGYDFVVGSCVQNRNQCPIAGQTCCQSGFYTGSCQESCAAGARTAEYSWIFSTGNIPLVPDMVECCGRNCPLANPLPSPSPWDGQANSQSVCVNALIRGTFTTNIDANRGNPEDNFVLEKCSAEGDNPCSEFTEVHTGAVVRNGAKQAEFSFSGEHTPNLEPDATYQVRIMEGLVAMPDAEAGRDGGEMRPDPKAVEACGGERHARGTAYCFRFRTNDRECAIGAVEVVPKAFTAKELGFLVATDDNNVIPELMEDSEPLYRSGVTAAGNSCVALDPARFDWQWQESSRGEIAAVRAAGREGSFTRFVQTIKPSDTLVTISATASGVTGSGTLLVSPGDPQIIAAWPQCQEACVNVDAGVSFNIPMDGQTLTPWFIGVHQCRNELCKMEDVSADFISGRFPNMVESITYEDVNDSELPPYAKHRARFNFRGDLAVGAFYRVVITPWVQSRDGVSITKLSDEYDFPVTLGPQSQLWKSFVFRVRNDAAPCAIKSVAVQPVEGTVRAIGSQKWFRASAQGEENGCGPNGGAELLNAANMSWAWTAAEPAVVELQPFDVSARPVVGCTAQCLLTGSQVQPRLCGNGQLDAGEDCDPANGTWCSDRCLFAGTAAPTCGNNNVDEGEQCDGGNAVAGDGCSEKCLVEGASVTKVTCGNTDIAPGENCDDGNVKAGDGCSPECVKEGTSISEAWCRGQGDGAKDRYPACANAVSSCGNGVLESGEACDPPQADVCSERCLLVGGAGKATCGNGALEPQLGEECDDGNAVSGDGCESCLLRGSSLRYSTASMCGDGRIGTGESFRCESNQHGDGRPDPVVLATLQSIAGHEQELQGEGAAEVRIETEINAEASYNETTGAGSAKLVLQCGFTQADQCPDPDNYGVGSNGCCYAYPTISDMEPTGEGACRNPALKFTIGSGISSKSLENNILVAVARVGACSDGEQEIAIDNGVIRLVDKPRHRRLVDSLKNVFDRFTSAFIRLVVPLKYKTAQTVYAQEVAATVGDMESIGRQYGSAIINAGHIKSDLDQFVSLNADRDAQSIIDLRERVRQAGLISFQLYRDLDAFSDNTIKTWPPLKLIDRQSDRPLTLEEIDIIINFGSRLQPYRTRFTTLRSTINRFKRDLNAAAGGDRGVINSGRFFDSALGYITTIESKFDEIDVVITRVIMLRDAAVVEAIRVAREAALERTRAEDAQARSATEADILRLANAAGSDAALIENQIENLLQEMSTLIQDLTELANGDRGMHRTAQRISVFVNALRQGGRPADQPVVNALSSWDIAAQKTIVENEAVRLGSVRGDIASARAAVGRLRNNPMAITPEETVSMRNAQTELLSIHTALVGVRDSFIGYVEDGRLRNYLANEALINITNTLTEKTRTAERFALLWEKLAGAIPSSRWCVSTLHAKYRATINADKTTEVQIMPSSLLAPNSRYRIIVNGGAKGVRDGRNVPLKENFEWQFSTGPHVCTLDQVRVEPNAWVFSTVQQGTGPLCSVDADCGDGGLCVDAQGGDGKRCDLSRHRFTARAYTGVNENVREIAPVTGSYDWSYGWGPTNDDSIIDVTADQNAIAALVATKQGKSGDETVMAKATIVADSVNNPPQVNASSTRVVTGVSQVMVSACQRPWPALVGGPPVFPYEDVAGNDDGIDIAPAGMLNIWTNFSAWYCMDGASVATTTDDLPSLTPQFIQYNKQGSSLLKRFHLLTPDGEAIGMMVRTNPQWLSLADWYENEFPGQGKPRPIAPIDGFEAAQLADTVYVNAVNHDPLNGSLFANVYVISMSGVGRAKPSAALRNIFDQIVKNLQFTVNIDQFNRCAAENDQVPDLASPKCSADVACTGDWTGRQCLADRDKLRRDLTRMHDAETLLGKLKDYKRTSGNFPRLNEVENQVGSFVPFFTTSKWGSWQSALGNTLATRVPEDPVNKFIGCSVDDGYDAEMCWNASSQQFQCNGGNVYQYRTTPDGQAADVWMNFEFFDPIRQRELAAQIAAVAGDGVALQEGACVAEGQVIGAGSATCGNGILEPGEVCDGTAKTVERCQDPNASALGRLVNGETIFDRELWQVNGCRNDCAAWVRVPISVGLCTNGVNVCVNNQECPAGSTCRLQAAGGQPLTLACVGRPELERASAAGVIQAAAIPGALCGNGVLDVDEECDDGALNGRYGGYCSETCVGRTGYCGDGRRQSEEICDPTAPPANNRQAGATWASNRNDSCGWDCQSYGLYCGDNIVTNTLGANETCDDGNRRIDDGCDEQCHAELRPPAVCGNGRKEGAEQCDGGERCDAQCRMIGAYCGNSLIDDGEVCDNGDQNGAACTGEYGRQCSYCSADCRTVRFASGPYCGDGHTNRPQEICDATDVPGYKCWNPVTTIQVPAALRCKSSSQCAEPECTGNNTLCKDGERCCGNGLIEAPEVCDGAVEPQGKLCIDKQQSFSTARVLSCDAVCAAAICDGDGDRRADDRYVLCTQGQDCKDVTIQLGRGVALGTETDGYRLWFGQGDSLTQVMSSTRRDMVFTRTLPVGQYTMKIELSSANAQAAGINKRGIFGLILPQNVTIVGEPKRYASGWDGWHRDPLLSEWFLTEGRWFYQWKDKFLSGTTALSFRNWLTNCEGERGPMCGGRADFQILTQAQWDALLLAAKNHSDRPTVFDVNTKKGVIYRDAANSLHDEGGGFVQLILNVQ